MFCGISYVFNHQKRRLFSKICHRHHHHHHHHHHQDQEVTINGFISHQPAMIWSIIFPCLVPWNTCWMLEIFHIKCAKHPSQNLEQCLVNTYFYCSTRVVRIKPTKVCPMMMIPLSDFLVSSNEDIVGHIMTSSRNDHWWLIGSCGGNTDTQPFFGLFSVPHFGQVEDFVTGGFFTNKAWIEWRMSQKQDMKVPLPLGHPSVAMKILRCIVIVARWCSH